MTTAQSRAGTRLRWGAVLLAVAACGALLAPEAAGAAPPSAVPAGSGVWISSRPGQSLASAVLPLAAASAPYAARVRAIIPLWEKAVAAGSDLKLPGVADRSPAGQRAALADLRAGLARQAAGQAVPAVDTGNPNTFPIRGQRDPSGLFWTAKFEVDLAFCDPGCQTTDRYTSNVTINPGATVTRINGRNLHVATQAGHLGNKHFEMWAVCRGSVCAHENTGDLPNTSVDYLRDYGDRHGNVLTVGLTLWVYWNPLGNYYPDSGKTHDCDCEAKNVGNACRYSY